MENIRRRKIPILVEIEHLIQSPVLGEITDDMLQTHIQAFVDSVFVNVPLIAEEGDFFNLVNPKVFMTKEQLDLFTFDKIPTDDASILADFERDGTDVKYLAYEKRCRELENEGCDRSDAQGIAGTEGLDPDFPQSKKTLG